MSCDDADQCLTRYSWYYTMTISQELLLENTGLGVELKRLTAIKAKLIEDEHNYPKTKLEI